MSDLGGDEWQQKMCRAGGVGKGSVEQEKKEFQRCGRGDERSAKRAREAWEDRSREDALGEQ